ncbi:MAG: hypothetical protein V2I33_24380, partial [Kangiellaceae bacterium]|nr:hypothetical protein [Kangiellaceae bacterium]
MKKWASKILALNVKCIKCIVSIKFSKIYAARIFAAMSNFHCCEMMSMTCRHHFLSAPALSAPALSASALPAPALSAPALSAP